MHVHKEQYFTNESPKNLALKRLALTLEQKTLVKN